MGSANFESMDKSGLLGFEKKPVSEVSLEPISSKLLNELFNYTESYSCNNFEGFLPETSEVRVEHISSELWSEWFNDNESHKCKDFLGLETSQKF